jgi:hypothetical protein
MHAASKALVRVAFAKATPDKPPGKDAKAKKAAADKHKAATAAATSTVTGNKPGDGTKLHTKK